MIYRIIGMYTQSRRQVLISLGVLLLFVPFGNAVCQFDESGTPMEIDMSVEELIKRHVQALGGEDKVSAIRDETVEDEFDVQYGSLSIIGSSERTTKVPNKMYSHSKTLAQDKLLESIDWCDGSRYTQLQVRDNDTGKTITQYEGEDLAKKLDGLQHHPLIRFKELGYTLTIKSKELIRNAPVYLVELKTKFETKTYFINGYSYLITSVESQVESPAGTVASSMGYSTMKHTTSFSDYRPVDGVLFPFKITNQTKLYRGVTTVKSYKINTGVSDDVFVKP